MRPNLLETADLVTFTEKILYGNVIFCAVIGKTPWNYFSFVNFALTLKGHVCPLLSTQNSRKPRYKGLCQGMTGSKQIPYLKNDIYLFIPTLNKTGIYWDALHDLVPFVQFKKREKHMEEW